MYRTLWNANVLLLQSLPQPLPNCENGFKILGTLSQDDIRHLYDGFLARMLPPEVSTLCIDVTVWALLTVTCVFHLVWLRSGQVSWVRFFRGFSSPVRPGADQSSKPAFCKRKKKHVTRDLSSGGFNIFSPLGTIWGQRVIGITGSLIWSKPWWNWYLTPAVNFGKVRRAQLAKSTLHTSSLVPLGSFQIF